MQEAVLKIKRSEVPPDAEPPKAKGFSEGSRVQSISSDTSAVHGMNLLE